MAGRADRAVVAEMVCLHTATVLDTIAERADFVSLKSERPIMPLIQQFAQDRQGRRFADVLNDARISFPAILAFFNDPHRQQRLLDSELYHDRPALAGVVRELEHRPDVDQFFRTNDGHVTTRFRQAIGVVVRIIMESHGWKTTGRKGSLGVRAKGPTRTVTAGADHNT